MTAHRSLWIAATIAALSAGGALAGTVRTWSPATSAELAAGELDGVTADELGRLRLAPAVEPVWGPDRGVVWSLDAAGDGGAFAGLSDPARVVRVGHSPQAQTWYDGEPHAWVTAVAAGHDGSVWAGISPEGRLLLLSSPSKLALSLEVGAAYVWALELDERGDLWIGTGSPGKLLRVRRGRDSAETVHETGDDAIRSLAAIPGGGVIAGTAARGRVLTAGPDGTITALFDADEDEIVALEVDPAGAVWALAAKETRPISSAPRTEGAVETPDSGRPPSAEATGEPDAANRSAEGSSTSVTVRATAAAPATPVLGAALYRIEPAGAVTRVWSSRSDLAYGLALDGDGRAWVGAGDAGRVYRVEPSGAASILVDLPASRVTALARDRRGRLFLGTAGDARIVISGPAPVTTGTFLSAPIDAGGPADWGRLAWSGRGEAVELAVRTGNSSEPDSTWSEWVAPERRPPTGRFAQVRARLAPRGDPGTLIVERLELAYAARNRAPTIESLTVEPPGVAWVRQIVPSGPRGGLQIADDPLARRASAEESARAARNAPVRKSYEPGVRTLSWDAKDEDGDRMVAALEFRRLGDDTWAPLASGVADSFHSWDARGMPDGEYRVRLTVTDLADNAAGDERSAQRVSEPFFLDGTPPTIEGLAVEREGGRAVVRFVASDPAGRIEAAEFSVADGEFRLARPLDGLTDSEIERYAIVLPEDAAGDVVTVRVRVSDRAGNLAGDLVRVGTR